MNKNKYYIKKEKNNFFDNEKEKLVIETKYVIYKKHNKNIKYTASTIALISIFMFLYESLSLLSQEYIPEGYFKLFIWYALLIPSLPLWLKNDSDKEIEELNTKKGAEEYIKWLESDEK